MVILSLSLSSIFVMICICINVYFCEDLLSTDSEPMEQYLHAALPPSSGPKSADAKRTNIFIFISYINS